MVIHAHHSQSLGSGEMKRIININIDIAGIITEKIVEVEFYSFRDYKYVHTEGQFKLSNKVFKKYYIPNIARLGILNSLYCSLVISFLCIRFKPTHYIEEWTLPLGLRKLRNLLFRGTQLILDIHGAAPEEAFYSTGIVHKNLENSEYHSISIADYIVCQSDEMKRHLIKKYGCDENCICVYRCGVDTNVFNLNEANRILIRKQLKLSEDDKLFVYSGGVHKWQKVSVALKYFQNYHTRYPSSKMLVLTKDVEGFYKIINDERLENLSPDLIVKSLPYNEVPLYLNASDISFLIRDDVLMNAVASPTKLAEYMACGLPVISSRVAVNWLTPEGMNYVINFENTGVEKLHTILSSIDRKLISNYSINTLSLAIDRARVKQFFLEI